MIGEYLRLAFATFVVLLPGRLVARALGQRGSIYTLAWGFAALFLAWAAVFVVHGTVWLAAGILGVIGVAALAYGKPRSAQVLLPTPAGVGFRMALERSRPVWGRGTAFAGGLVLGLLLWQVEGAVTGDALFHEARVRKLVDLDHLHLRSVDELAKGGLHPGYAFPLWHGFLALVTKLSGLDPSVVLHREATLLVPLAVVVAWEAGVALFGSSGGGFAVVASSIAIYCFAAGHGGSYVSLALPATSSRQLFVPVVIALFFTFAETGRRADLGALSVAFGALALIHPTYALFALIPLAAYSLVRYPEWRRSGLALAAGLVPSGLVVLWLRPLVNETISHNPPEKVQSATLAHYGNELVVSSVHRFRLAAEVPGRTGAVAIVALALVPLAGFAAKRRWGAFVLGGTVAVLALMLVPELFVRFSNAVSLSQSRRAAGFVPFAFAFAGGLAILARSALLVPLGLVAGIALEHRWPGDFAYGLRRGGPAAITWFALVAGATALVLGLVFARERPKERFGLAALTAILFVLPVAVHGFGRWSPLNPTDPNALAPALSRQLAQLSPGTVVIASPAVSYEILARFPVYVVAAPVVHVANTRSNDPNTRVREVEHWLATGDPAIPRRYGATVAVRKGKLIRLVDPGDEGHRS
ncbi:MAG TPA: hypothetical protein VGM80_03820 [Gaiellaceae bacterium]